jgi:hypothetical protein
MDGFARLKGVAMKRFSLFARSLLILTVAASLARAETGTSKGAAAPSAAQRVLDQAAEDEKFTFLLFYKSDTPQMREMAKVVKAGVAKRNEKATLALVQVTDPAEKGIVDKFDVSRSPMPLVLAVAPNLAVTGIFPKEIKEEHFDAAIVTPTMTRCMKSLQEGKLVFVCVQTSEKPATPPVVKAMQIDPEFSSRVVVVSMQLNDPEEGRFLQQMQVDPKQVRAPIAALLAPPGVLIGKYDAAAKKDQVVGALHEAGKCCDDPNCKHNHGESSQAPANTRRK